MKEIQLTQGKVTQVDEEDFYSVSRHGWYFMNSGYAVATIKGKKVLLHRFIMSAPIGLEVDHVNGDKLDNRKNNLRLCTRQQNEVNKNPGKNNTSGFRGVVKHKNGFKAQTYFMKKNIHIGYFKTEEEAVSAYKAKVKELFGEFAKT